MGGFVFVMLLKLLEWAAVAAAVLTYIEIGPGGDSLAAIVHAIRDVLLQIDWAALGGEIVEGLKALGASIVDSSSEIETTVPEVESKQQEQLGVS